MDRAIPCHHIHELQSFKIGPNFSPTLYIEAVGDDKFAIEMTRQISLCKKWNANLGYLAGYDCMFIPDIRLGVRVTINEIMWTGRDGIQNHKCW